MLYKAFINIQLMFFLRYYHQYHYPFRILNTWNWTHEIIFYINNHKKINCIKISRNVLIRKKIVQENIVNISSSLRVRVHVRKQSRGWIRTCVREQKISDCIKASHYIIRFSCVRPRVGQAWNVLAFASHHIRNSHSSSTLSRREKN